MTDYAFKIYKSGQSYEAVECDASGNPSGTPFPVPLDGDKDHLEEYPGIAAYLKERYKIDADLSFDLSRDTMEVDLDNRDPRNDRTIYTFKRPPDSIKVIDPARTMRAAPPPKRQPGKPG